jgi:hypothetical protein
VIDRVRYRREVERLLELIGERTRELDLLEAHGARGAALHQRKLELGKVRMELAAVTAASSY